MWFSGRRLAADLSLPNLRARWASAEAESGPGQPAIEEAGRPVSVPVSVPVSEKRRAAAVDSAVSAMEQATAALTDARSSSEGLSGLDGDGVAHAAGDMLAAVGVVTAVQDPEGRVSRVAGDVFDRATRVPGRVLPVRWPLVAVGLRSAAWELAAVRHLSESGEADAARLIVALAAVVAEVAALREAQRRPAQAAAARRSYDTLAAVPVAAAAVVSAWSVSRSPKVGHSRGQEPPRPVRPVASRRAPFRDRGQGPERSPGL